ncbi:MAG: 4-hydroxy-tetrahydrodipicolinate synthase [Pseudomonadota bacterium]
MFQGNIVALITPMTEDGQLDLKRLPGLLDYLLAGGVHGIVAAGTTGEGATLDEGEFEALVDAVVTHINGRIPVLAGTGMAGTAHTVARTRLVAQLGVDAALVVTPYYNRPTQEGLAAHFTAVADEGAAPVVLYNVPTRTASDLRPETVGQLAAHPNIVALKEAVPGADRIRALREATGDRLTLLSGDDDSCADAMGAGANGVISVVANLAPAAWTALCAASLAGDADKARAILATLQPLLEQISVETNPIPVKWGAYELGLVGPGIRLPLVPLTQQHRPALRASLERLGLMPGMEN